MTFNVKRLWASWTSGMDRSERTWFVLFILFFLSLYNPFYEGLYNMVLLFMFVNGVWSMPIRQSWRRLLSRPELFLMIVFFLFNLLSALVSSNTKSGISFLGIRIALFAFPLAIGTMRMSRLLYRRILESFVVITSIAALGSIAYAMYRVSKSGNRGLWYNDSLSESVHMQSIYFALLVTIAVFALLYLCWGPLSSKLRKGAWIMLPLLLGVHFLLASRISIIILYGIGLVAGLSVLVKRRKFLEMAVLIMGLAVGAVILIRSFPKTINRFKELTYTHFDFSSMGPESHYNMPVTAGQWNGANIRLAVWQCAWSVIARHPVLGTGLGDKTDSLREQYRMRQFTFALQTNRNVHNTYLDVWMSMGIIGLLLFLAGFLLVPLWQQFRLQNGLALLLIITLAIAWLTETYLDRTIGNILAGFWLSFIAASGRLDKD